MAVVPFFVLLGAVWWAVGDDVRELSTGEDVAVIEISGCTSEGSAVNGQAPYCKGKWRFADGRVDGGRILGGEIAEGDTVFAGDGFAYRSKSSLIWNVVMIGAVGVGMLGAVIGVGVAYLRDKARRPRE